MPESESQYPAGLGTPGLFAGRIEAESRAREAMINDLGTALTHELVNAPPPRTSEAGQAVRAVLFRIAERYGIELPE